MSLAYADFHIHVGRVDPNEGKGLAELEATAQAFDGSRNFFGNEGFDVLLNALV